MYYLVLTCLPSKGSTSLITLCVVLSLFTRRETYAIPTLDRKEKYFFFFLGQSFDLTLFYLNGKFTVS